MAKAVELGLSRVAFSAVLFLYLLPLSAVVYGHSLTSWLFLIAFCAVSFFSWFAFKIVSSHNQKLTAADHSGLFVAPRMWLYLTAAGYCTIKFPSILSASSALISGNISQVMLANAVNRYSGDFTGGSVVDVLALIFLFAFYCFWGSRIGIRTKGVMKWFPLFFALFSFFIESLALARAGFLLALLCYFVEAIIRSNRWIENSSVIKMSKLGFGIAAVAISIFIFSAYFRVSDLPNAWEIVFGKMANYSIASHDLFFLWFSSSDLSDLNWGLGSFTFVYKLAGIEFEQGFYEPMISKFGSSNLYLNLRGLVNDFGLPISLSLWCLNLLFISYCTYSALTPIKYYFLRCSLAFLLFPFYSPFFFTNFSVGFVASGIALIVFSRYRFKRSARLVV